LTLVAYWPIRHNGFVSFDDEEYITRNTVIKRGLTLSGIGLAFTRSRSANWHPLTWVSHMVDVELFGLDPRGHHLAGVALHLAAAIALLLTLRAMTGRLGPPLLVAALFAVHPLHVESVAWAAERKDVLSALFWMLTLAAYLGYARRRGAGRYLLVLLCFALGLMAKPMLVTLPLVLLLLDLWPLGRLGGGAAGRPADRPTPAALVLEKLPLFALSALSALITFKAQAGAVAPLVSYPAGARAANALLSPVRYLLKALWPVDLAAFYPVTIRTPADPRVVAAAVALAAGTVAALALRRSRPWLLAGWGWYLVTLLPVLGIVQVGEQAMADRYTYIPLVGVCIAAAWSLPDGAKVRAGAAAALVLLVGLTQRQVEVWHDEVTLFRHAVAVTAENWKATYNLAVALDAAGEHAEALRLARDAIRMKPDFSKARYAVARVLDAQGRTAEAIAELRAAVAALPTDPVIGMSLATMLSREGRDEEAIVQLRELIRNCPGVAEAYNNLAALLAERGERQEAVSLLRRALAIDPSYADARHNLEALTGERLPLPDRDGYGDVPTTHRALFGDVPGTR
jgi:tetratricopeptide (TPR) repeat protein